jgi:polysaccharide biosynthesis protein PslJ
VINATELEIWTRYGAKRVVGTSQVHIEFSVVAAMTVLLTIYFARNAAKREVRWAAALACSLAFVAVPAAVSRTGVIALAAALFVYMWCFSVRQVIVAIAAGCVAILTYIQIFPTTANAVWNTVVNSRDDPSVLERTADYAAVSQTFRAHPVFGLGLGGALPTEYRYLDNEWLQAIVQGGTVGLAAMIVLTGGGIFGIAAALRRAGNTREREQAYLLGSMFVGILVSSFTFDLFSNLQATLIFYLTFGLLWCNFTVPLTAASHRASRVRNRRLV